ncbi:MAG: hypothetical protein H8E42_01690 [Nitrospinae bacterium]|nr:hypothetical protein [Nitrospinota bacterium]MBL7019403.1 hypothetical protein [Nitrospinaceae bacterium]
MLVFKKNIYETSSHHPENGTQQNLDPRDFIFRSLTTDREIFYGLQQLAQEESQERFKTLFPHVSRFGSISLINNFSRSLLEGLIDKDNWYTMNAYHMTYLFDSLHGTFEDYSYSDPAQRKELFPELQGEAIDFDHFLENYFFGTAFLMDAERFNNMLPEEKKDLKLTDPCLFGVINRLIPAEEEIVLKISMATPYSP